LLLLSQLPTAGGERDRGLRGRGAPVSFDVNGLALKCRHTAVNDEFGTQHESGFGRRQIKYPGGDLLRRTKAFDRDLALNPIFGFLKFLLGNSISRQKRR